jgi:3-oxoacyl-[acyl-carrier protein] reductase
MPRMQIDKRSAIVVGGSRGIGAAIARRLARDGLVVTVTYTRHLDAAAAVVSDIERHGGTATVIQVDVTDPESIVAAFAAAETRFGPPDVVVHSAAIGETGPVTAIDEDQIQRIVQTNIIGTIRVGVAAAKSLQEDGRLILISSLNGRIPTPGGSLYAASKAALESLTRSWAHELGPRRITVNAVAPGFTQTDMLDDALPEPMRPQAIALTALGRIGEPDDIADVVGFLASDAGRWVTGQVIGADGGLRAW